MWTLRALRLGFPGIQKTCAFIEEVIKAFWKQGFLITYIFLLDDLLGTTSMITLLNLYYQLNLD